MKTTICDKCGEEISYQESDLVWRTVNKTKKGYVSCVECGEDIAVEEEGER